MSLLTPLYLLGGLAVAAPLVFHLIRRSPRGQVLFGSVMFLSPTPTPPTLTRRSRIDAWLLLALRAGAVLLLAAAFARPFLREAQALGTEAGERRRVVLLIDVSASLRRGDLWRQVQRLADEAVGGCRPGDELAVMTFGGSTRTLLGFDESRALDPSRRNAVARSRIAGLTPTWEATDLGRALIDAVGAADDLAPGDESGGSLPRRLVVVSDFQLGSRLEALGGFEWPAHTAVELKTVGTETSNAGLRRLQDAEDAQTSRTLRIRVSNDAASNRENFRLNWIRGDAEPEAAGETYVPPNQSRVVSVIQPAGGDSIRLEGDEETFDNLLYVADEPRREVEVVFLGGDGPDDPSGLLYYLARAFSETPQRSVKVRRADSAELPRPIAAARTPLIVATQVASDSVDALERYANEGGTVLLVLREASASAGVAALAGVAASAGVEGTEIAEASLDGDVMLGEVAFDHPLFAAFAGPQFNDFTKIRFSKYRRVGEKVLGDARVVARYENGDPAVVEKAIGKGRLVLFTSGWSPADSQLARSSKFVPLMSALLDRRAAERPAEVLVGEAIPLTAEESAAGVRVRAPGGVVVKTAANAMSFGETTRPGLYRIESPIGTRTVAVNLDPAESRTAPLPAEALQQLGVRFDGPDAAPPGPEQRRQLMNAELEGRQKLWRWLMAAVAGALIFETWLAGRSGTAAEGGTAS